MGALTIRPAGIRDPAVMPLLEGLAEEYRPYGGLVDGELGLYAASEFTPPRGVLLLAHDHGEVVAGGALRRWAEGVGEIKRMWTAPSHRRRGLARRILLALEERAAAFGYDTVRLDTGRLQAAAIALYEEQGYEPVPTLGRYAGNPDARSYAKHLAR